MPFPKIPYGEVCANCGHPIGVISEEDIKVFLNTLCHAYPCGDTGQDCQDCILDYDTSGKVAAMRQMLIALQEE